MAIIEASGLTRTFKSRKRVVHAVRGVDLSVDDGEIVGFLGPNGAGKPVTELRRSMSPEGVSSPRVAPASGRERAGRGGCGCGRVHRGGGPR